MARGRPASGRDRLLSAALAVFSELGFRRATMEDIAKEAGVAISTLYNYFEGKEDIYRQTYVHTGLAWQAHVKEKLTEAHNACEKFRALSKESLGYVARNEQVRKLFQMDPSLFPPFDYYREQPELDIESMKMIREILAQGVREKAFRKMDIDTSVHVIFSLYRMWVMRILEAPLDREGQKLIDATIELLLMGLCDPSTANVRQRKG